jgi:hypothetical protein
LIIWAALLKMHMNTSCATIGHDILGLKIRAILVWRSATMQEIQW